MHQECKSSFSFNVNAREIKRKFSNNLLLNKTTCLESLKKIIHLIRLILIIVFFTIDTAEGNDATSQNSVWKNIWGEPTPSALYFGMATVHFNPDSLKEDNWNNQLIGADYKGFFAATLINSFGDRAYVLGLQRYVFTQQVTTNFTQNMGYRVGFISGYDERMTPIAAQTPLLLFPQIIYDVNYKNFGVDMSLSFVAVSFGFFYQF